MFTPAEPNIPSSLVYNSSTHLGLPSAPLTFPSTDQGQHRMEDHLSSLADSTEKKE